MDNLNSNKEILIDLSRIKDLEIELAWKNTFDLDTIIYLANKKDYIVETVCYQHLNGKGAYFNKKNKDCESIILDFHNIPQEVNKIFLCINIFNPQNGKFNDVSSIYIKAQDKTSNVELFKFDLKTSDIKCNTIHIANLIKNNNNWLFEMVEKGIDGSIGEIRTKLEQK